MSVKTVEERRAKGLYWDRAWKLVEGCRKVSPGCDNCWSETETVMRHSHPNEKIHDRAHKVLFESCPGGIPEKSFAGNVLMRTDNLDLPLRIKKPTVFAIWNDLYHDGVTGEFRDHSYAVMALCPQHTFLVLTKRADVMARSPINSHSGNCLWVGIRHAMEAHYGKDIGAIDKALPNVWHGVTVCNQAEADEKIPHLLDVPGKRFISLEPMLGPIDFSLVRVDDYMGLATQVWPLHGEMIHQVLLGGESGKGARPLHPDWVRGVRDQCATAGVPFMFKQWGEWLACEQTPNSGTCFRRCDNGEIMSYNAPNRPKEQVLDRSEYYVKTAFRVGKKKAGRLLDGEIHDSLLWDNQ